MARADGGAPPAVHGSRARRGRHGRPHARRGRRRRTGRIAATDTPGGRSADGGRRGARHARERGTPVTEQPTRIQVGGTAGTDPYEVLVGRQL
ncbi:hypothetical protein ACWGJZ_16560, partial [Streptomyces rimosus]